MALWVKLLMPHPAGLLAVGSARRSRLLESNQHLLRQHRLPAGIAAGKVAGLHRLAPVVPQRGSTPSEGDSRRTTET